MNQPIQRNLLENEIQTNQMAREARDEHTANRRTQTKREVKRRGDDM